MLKFGTMNNWQNIQRKNVLKTNAWNIKLEMPKNMLAEIKTIS